MIKVTFTLDDETVAYLSRTADRLGMPKSRVVREAIRLCCDQAEARIAVPALYDLAWRARLWTLNRDDFEDVPGLELV